MSKQRQKSKSASTSQKAEECFKTDSLKCICILCSDRALQGSAQKLLLGQKSGGVYFIFYFNLAKGMVVIYFNIFERDLSFVRCIALYILVIVLAVGVYVKIIIPLNLYLFSIALLYKIVRLSMDS